MIKLRQTFLNTVFWSVIAAAFIGPGTLATASSAGALFELDIMWALAFAILACIILQEGTARITILTGNDFGKTIQKYALTPFNRSIMYLITGGVLFGCAAYQAGNILGAISGLGMILSLNTKVLTVIVALSVFAVLWKGNISLITKILGVCVGIMGISFFAVALQAEFEWGYFFKSLVVPAIPQGGGLLVLGLVGTTIVPYNLFLGSSMGRGKSLKSMRVGVGMAVFIGGMISIAILISGTFIEEKVSFVNLAGIMEEKLGAWAKYLLAVGLFAAGFTSSVTAPLASAYITSGIMGKREEKPEQSRLFRLTWGIILFIGFLFGILDFQPMPVIIMAQALNGLVLPLVAGYLIILLNNHQLLGKEGINGTIRNALSFFVLTGVVMLGLNHIYQASNKIFFLSNWVSEGLFIGIGSLVIVLVILVRTYKMRNKDYHRNE